MKITIKWPRDRADGQLWERDIFIGTQPGHAVIEVDNAGEVRARQIDVTTVEPPAQEDYATVWRGLVDLTARVGSLETARLSDNRDHADTCNAIDADHAALRRIVRRLRKRLRVVDEPNGHGDQIVDLQNASRAQAKRLDFANRSHGETVQRVTDLENRLSASPPHTHPSTPATPREMADHIAHIEHDIENIRRVHGQRLDAHSRSLRAAGQAPTLADLTANAGPPGLTTAARWARDYMLPPNWTGQTAEIHEFQVPREAVYINNLGELLPGACGNSRPGPTAACTRPVGHPMTLHIGRDANGNHVGEWDANPADVRPGAGDVHHVKYDTTPLRAPFARVFDMRNTYLPAEVDALDPPCNHPPCGHRAHEHVGAISRSGMTGCVHLEPLPGVTPDRADLSTMPTSCPCARSREEVLTQTPSNKE